MGIPERVSPGRPLGAEARAWGEAIRAEYELDSAGELLLRLAEEALDRMHEAQAIVDDEGVVQVDRFGQKKPHPAVQVEQAAREQALRCVKALGLDLEPTGPIGRPPGSHRGVEGGRR